MPSSSITSAPPLWRFELIEQMAARVAEQLARVAERERTQAQLAQARDEAMEASRQKSEFLATMSHEIRTPLNGVIGLNDLLLRTTLTPEQQRLATGVQGASRTLLGIINDILDFSKIEAGRLELERLDFEVLTLLSSWSRPCSARRRGAKGLELTVACDPSLPRRPLRRPDEVRRRSSPTWSPTPSSSPRRDASRSARRPSPPGPRVLVRDRRRGHRDRCSCGQAGRLVRAVHPGRLLDHAASTAAPGSAWRSRARSSPPWRVGSTSRRTRAAAASSPRRCCSTAPWTSAPSGPAPVTGRWPPWRDRPSRAQGDGAGRRGQPGQPAGRRGHARGARLRQP